MPWSGAFKKELEREFRLNRKFRNTLRVFLDEDDHPDQGLDPLAPLSDEITNQVGASALMLALMSPDYLDSKWCTRERDTWLHRQTALDLPGKGRIAVVRILPTDGEWPGPLKDDEGNQLVGFRFHAAIDDTAEARPLGWLDIPGPFTSDARRAVIGLVGHLSAKLDELKAKLDERRRAKAEAEKLAAAAAGAAMAGGPSELVTIYLHGRADQPKAWERAATALADIGFAVTPGDPGSIEHDPVKLQDARAQRVRMLSDCDALLLVGASDGRALDEDLVTVARQDRNSARARSNRLLPCGLLDMVGAPIASPVRKATARILQTEWIDATRDPWTPEVRRWLGARSAQAGT